MSNLITLAEEYYTRIGQKDSEGIRNYLHDNVEFFGPLAHLQGKEAVVAATSHFMSAFRTLTIRAKFSTGHQAMIVYDVDLPGVSDHFPGASLMTFCNGLIVRIQLFYDGGRAEKKGDEIFGGPKS